ncbi:hypothetical protein GCM10010510_22970 [Streptomyces anandii JCM 4720]|nr:hypothetical protein GCM10010510_22970 [Streptomyces anandii JCM 4720]
MPAAVRRCASDSPAAPAPTITTSAALMALLSGSAAVSALRPAAGRAPARGPRRTVPVEAFRTLAPRGRAPRWGRADAWGGARGGCPTVGWPTRPFG